MKTFKPPFRISGTNHVVDANGVVLEPTEAKNIINLNDRLIAALRWYVENDDTNETEDNKFWLDGRNEAKRVLDDAKDIYQIK
jgi:hypothetical protein